MYYPGLGQPSRPTPGSAAPGFEVLGLRLTDTWRPLLGVWLEDRELSRPDLQDLCLRHLTVDGVVLILACRELRHPLSPVDKQISSIHLVCQGPQVPIDPGGARSAVDVSIYIVLHFGLEVC